MEIDSFFARPGGGSSSGGASGRQTIAARSERETLAGRITNAAVRGDFAP